MSRNNNDPSNNNKEQSPSYDAEVTGDNYRREPHFNRFDDDDGYEEPDRDTDLASDYRADNMEDEEYEDELPEEDERDVFSTVGADGLDESDPSGPDTWLDKEAYLDEDEGEESGRSWPLGLIATAVVALALLIAGGYGVMQQRAATQEEIRQLRAELATAASPEDASASRVALQDMKQSYEQLSAIAEAMKLENRWLADTVAGLEAQLGAQQAVLAKPLSQTGQAKTAAAAESTAPRPSATQPVVPPPPIKPVTPTPAATEPAATSGAATATAVATAGPWFVNFGTYASSNMAETWASRLHPGAGKVIVMPNNKDGQTLYRVRVVGLPDRNSAQEVARALEAELRVSALWVGKE